MLSGVGFVGVTEAGPPRTAAAKAALQPPARLIQALTPAPFPSPASSSFPIHNVSTWSNPLVMDPTPDPGAYSSLDGQHVVLVTSGFSPTGAFPLRYSEDGGITWELQEYYALSNHSEWWSHAAVSELMQTRTGASSIRPTPFKAADRRWKAKQRKRRRAGSSDEGDVPPWAQLSKNFWAPEIHRHNGRYLLYYTARDKDDVLVIGGAVSNSVFGPFHDELGRPLLRNTESSNSSSDLRPLGAIDPHMFVDNGTAYLLWKDDGNAQGAPTPIFIQELHEDGLTLKGSKVELIRNERDSWEGNVTEAPWMIREGEHYYLFYSGGPYFNERYALGVARSTSLWGPYTKAPSNPILKTALDHRSPFAGPGHNSVLKDPNGGYYTLYHAWRRFVAGNTTQRILKDDEDGGGRVLLRDPVWFDDDGWPVVGDGSREPTFGEGSYAKLRVSQMKRTSAALAANFHHAGRRHASEWPSVRDAAGPRTLPPHAS